MYGSMKPQRGKTPGTAKKQAPRRPAPKPPSKQTDPVEVYCRIRPLSDPEADVCIKVLAQDTILVTATENSHAFKTGGVLKETKYVYKQVFDECSPQKSVFEQVALPLVEDVVHGRNGLLFAYGVTSSGKTHTMIGSAQEPGVLPRCLDVIFNSIENLQAKKYVFKPDRMNGFDVQTTADAMMERQRRELLPKLNNMNTPRTPAPKEQDEIFDSNRRQREKCKIEDLDEDFGFSVFLSYVEIYNKYIYDLLEEVEYDPIMGYKPPTSKALREDNGHNMYVSGAIEVEVKNTEDAYDVLAKGRRRRRVAHTTLNAESSRSHSVLNIRVVQAPLDQDGEEILQDKDKVLVSQLSLVDLAGSERASRTGSHGDRLREAGNINNALMSLRSCIETLRENQQSSSSNKMVPYRDDRLTHLFKNYFEGEGKVRMIVCVNPKAEEYDETINVMKFAEMTQEVQVARQQQITFDTGLMHGRRRLREKYKEDLEKARKEVVNEIIAPAVPALLYAFDPLPPYLLAHPEDAITLPALAKYLQDRIDKRRALMDDYRKHEAAFRAHLVDMERENGTLKDRNMEVETLLKARETDISRMEKRIKTLEKSHDSLLRRNNSMERAKNTLEKEIGEREWQIQMATTQKQRLEHDSRSKMVMMEKNFNRKIEDAKRRLQAESASALRSQREKMAKCRTLLESDSSESISSTGSAARMPLSTRVNNRYVSSRIIYPAKSEPDLASVGTNDPPVPAPRSTHHRAMTTASGLSSGRNATKSTSRVPPPTKPKPNMKYHRRSRSSHEVWVDHNSQGGRDADTVLTPNIRARRSVTKLNTKDIKDVDKYLLTHVDVDSEGDMATKLYKGDVLRTSGGGKAVIFNDVEVLKHKSPGDRKRKSNEDRPEDYDGDFTDAEERCRIAIEGHGHLKRTKTSQV